MTRSQKNSLKILTVSFLVFISIIWIGYQNHLRLENEGLVYLQIFKPDQQKEVFKNVVAMSTPTICQSDKLNFKGVPENIITHFFEANTENASPIRLSALEGKVPILGWEDTSRIHRKGLADLFNPPDYKLLRLSRVGFNDQFTEALVCINITGKGGGEGIFYYLKKEDDIWTVIMSGIIWVS